MNARVITITVEDTGDDDHDHYSALDLFNEVCRAVENWHWARRHDYDHMGPAPAVKMVTGYDTPARS